MTEENLKQAKLNYKELLKEQKEFLKKKKQFYDFVQNDNQIQEFLALQNWNYFDKRYYELIQENSVKVYLYLMSKYNNFIEKIDNELVELSFNNIIKEQDSNNIYVYLKSYTFDDYYEKVEVKDKKNAIAHEYINLETKQKKIISVEDNSEFINNNRIIIFKNKHHKPEELFNRYRIMYLRQFLLDNNKYLFKNQNVKKYNK